SSNAHALTGDGPSVLYRRGIPMQDMEFFQFHPTGIYKLGILLSEAARGEGAVFLNGKGERFMERYMPTLKDLAPRDICSRYIYVEVREGRGVGGKDYVHMDFRPETINRLQSGPGGKDVTREHLEKALPDIIEFVRVYQGIDPMTQPVPIQPTAHYAMGGIPTDVDGRVWANNDTLVTGLYSAGECACVSVHGANRLGTNSLVDLVVFGRRGGKHMAQFCKQAAFAPLAAHSERDTAAEFDRIRANSGAERPAVLRAQLQKTMTGDVGVFRNGPDMVRAIETIRELKERYQKVRIDDTGKIFNTDILEVFELGCLLDLADVTAQAALRRTETRGGHAREDFDKRDDVNWLNHSLAYRADGQSGAGLTAGAARFDKKPVAITRFQPKERKY
ncbi:MAG TPA: FAD-binding protein, partial [Anaerolineales bacterium]|nr:FAD-binding protein [Anaerolineales bacterium]